MKEQGCSVLIFDKVHVVIRWEGSSAFDLLDFLFKDSLHSSSDSTLPLFILKAIKPKTFILYQEEKFIYRGGSGKTAHKLLNHVILALTKQTKAGPLFHAAALSRNGRSILIPGKSGSGKTFLAANLADNGYSYLTDEVALVEPENSCLNGFYKPLHIKNAPAFDRQFPLKTSDRNGYRRLEFDKGFFISCFHVDSAKRYPNTNLAIIVFPKYEPGIEFEVKRLTSANTGFLLMKNLINAGNLTSHGLHEISMLSRKIPAYLMTYGNTSQAVREVNNLVSL